MLHLAGSVQCNTYVFNKQSTLMEVPLEESPPLEAFFFMNLPDSIYSHIE